MSSAPLPTCALCGAHLTRAFRGAAALDVTVVSTDGLPLNILQSVTFALAPGSSTAVLTAAGAGGTTLLRALARRFAAPGAPRRRFDDAPLWSIGTTCGAAAGAHVALVAEQDALEPHQTVREALALVHACAYAAEPDAAPTPCAGCDRLSPAAVVAALGLESALDVRADALSGGQRRRLTVAEAFVGAAGGAEKRAPVLLLDCAASGLDSGSAARLLTFSRSRARATGGILVATLKAPEPELLDIFENVIILADGRVLFHGPCDAAAPFIARALGATRGPRVSLPVFLCAIASDGTARLADAWASSEEAVADRAAAIAMVDEAATTTSATAAIELPLPRSACAQFRVLLPAALLRVARDRTVVGARIGSTAIFGAILGWLASAAVSGQSDPSWRFGVFLFAPIFMAFLSQSELPGFYVSRAVVYRQTMTARLSTSAWVAAGMVAAFPLVVFSGATPAAERGPHPTRPPFPLPHPNCNPLPP
jgi:ABC-type multidrug transport system ATPase subunit